MTCLAPKTPQNRGFSRSTRCQDTYQEYPSDGADDLAPSRLGGVLWAVPGWIIRFFADPERGLVSLPTAGNYIGFRVAATLEIVR